MKLFHLMVTLQYHLIIGVYIVAQIMFHQLVGSLFPTMNRVWMVCISAYILMAA